MNYSKNVRYKRKPKVPLFVKRVLVFWLVALIIGGVIGFLIGRSISAVGLEETEVMAETSTTIPSPTPYVTSTPIQETSEPLPTTELVSLGEYRITAYCHCEQCCGNWAKNRPVDEDGSIMVFTASGELAVEGLTIAADTSVLPFGTEVIIDDIKYIVQDRGRAIKNNRIDVYFESHQDALEFGVQYKEVFIERMIEND